jgi:hypothetical protein
MGAVPRTGVFVRRQSHEKREPWRVAGNLGVSAASLAAGQLLQGGGNYIVPGAGSDARPRNARIMEGRGPGLKASHANQPRSSTRAAHDGCGTSWTNYATAAEAAFPVYGGLAMIETDDTIKLARGACGPPSSQLAEPPQCGTAHLPQPGCAWTSPVLLLPVSGTRRIPATGNSQSLNLRCRWPKPTWAGNYFFPIAGSGGVIAHRQDGGKPIFKRLRGGHA